MKESKIQSKVLLISFCITCLSTTIPTTVAAENYYALFDAGIAIPQKFNADYYDKKAPSKSGLFKIGAGYQLNDFLRSDLTLEHRNNFKVKLFHEDGVESGNVSQKIKSTALKLNGTVDIARVNAFTPYLTAGLGVAFNKFGPYTHQYTQSPVDKEVLTWSGKTNKNLIWSVGLGSRVEVTSDIAINLAYNYTNLGTLKNSGAVQQSITNTAGVRGRYPLSTEVIKQKLKTHEIALGIAYKF